LNIENWHDWNCDLINSNDSEDYYAAGIESETLQTNGIKEAECSHQLNLSVAPNVAGLVWPTRKSESQAETILVMVNSIEMRGNQGVNIK